MPLLPKEDKKPWIKSVNVASTKDIIDSQYFYNSRTWRKVRKAHITQSPLCVECRNNGRYISANIVDHIIPIRMGGARLDKRNFQSLCDIDHNKKRALESQGIIGPWQLNELGEKIPL